MEAKDVESLLPGLYSPRRLALAQDKSYERTVFRSLQKLFRKHPQMFPAEIYSWKNFLWAYNVFTTRAFADKSKADILVPFNDLFNHHWNISSKYGYNTHLHDSVFDYQLKFKMRTVSAQNYKPGEEFVIAYHGGWDNSQMLMQYGFIIPGYNRSRISINFDKSVKPFLVFDESDPTNSKQVQANPFLDDLLSTAYYQLTHLGFNQMLLMHVRILILLTLEEPERPVAEGLVNEVEMLARYFPLPKPRTLR
eukprot:TRINITY_DN11093_c0_g1_i1.p1 TRINITY_DN11093_c0_g1~~TRINITY_DN11093_c0_g1_i1.p1  ORF type:complete len:251 (+),score=49.29 TRINITY_DN11093_c0_g1_i1:456-1208(+)